MCGVAGLAFVHPLRIITGLNSENFDIIRRAFWISTVSRMIAWPVYLVRVWLLFYDMQLNHLLQNKNWQMAINPFRISNNWYLNPTNQSLFGKNGKYLFSFAVLFGIVHCGVIYYFLSLEKKPTTRTPLPATLFTIFVYLFSVIIGIFIWKKLSRFKNYDNFGIRNEFKIVMIASLFAFLMLLPYSFIIAYYDLNWYFVNSVTATIYTTLIMYISVPYVIKVNENKNKWNKSSSEMDKLSISIKSRSQSATPVPPAGPRPALKSVTSNEDVHNIVEMKHWSQVVRTSFGFELFMTHLQSEFCTENLLFVYEVELKLLFSSFFCFYFCFYFYFYFLCCFFFVLSLIC